jgi:ABC-type polysaccharide/polyol phosphate transport system ATPase subunit
MAGPPTAENDTALAGRSAARSAAPVVIEVRGLGKSFRVPDHRFDSLRDRAIHPLTRVSHREHRALQDISFDVHRGEFFGIVGRNGSGKSTLLKILAGIYRRDAGTVRTAGRVAPFIELGVGFDPELTARENGLLNGVLMGLSLRESRRRLSAILDFAELGDFVELKLKNYSSGMLVRFAFAVMVQADADVMLIDEVLAVGDAAFAAKCMDVFHEKRRAGRTIVLVTHDMTTVQTLCHRAMVVEAGRLVHVGEPEDAALHYYRLNFPDDAVLPGAAAPGDKVVDVNTRVVHAAVRAPGGGPAERLPEASPLELDVLLEAARPLERPRFIVQVRNDDGQIMFAFTRTLDASMAPGERVRLAGPVEHPLLAGRYALDVYVREDAEDGGVRAQGLRLLHFELEGPPLTTTGLMAVRAEIEPAIERPGG